MGKHRLAPRARVTHMGDDDVSSSSLSATWAVLDDGTASAAGLTRFAATHGLTDVFLVAAGEDGEEALGRAGTDLHSEGLLVAAVAADPRWALDPRPLMRWLRRIRTGASSHDIDGVHLDIEPWRLGVWDLDRMRATRGLVELLRLARGAVPDLPLSADLPHWLAGEPYWPPPTALDPASAELPAPPPSGPPTGAGAPSSRGRIRTGDAPPRGGHPRADAPPVGMGVAGHLPPPLPHEPGMPGAVGMRLVEPRGVAAARRSRRSVFDEALTHLDSVTILVPRTRTHGPGGILDASSRARGACALVGVPYLIGLEARPRELARSPRATFHDEGEAALLREADRLAEALADDPLFRGIAVHDWAAWSGLGG